MAQMPPMMVAPGMMPPPGSAMVAPGMVSPWSVEADADALHHAMKGLGTDDSVLIEIVGGRPREHLVAVAAAYKAKHGHTLISDIKGDTSFHYQKLLVSLVKPMGEYLADLIFDAVDGAGTKENELIDVIAMVFPWEMKALHEAWECEYKKKRGSLDKCIEGETSFNFKKLLVHALKTARLPPGVVDAARVASDADAFYRAGEKRMGTDDTMFIELVARNSAEHLQAVSQEYARLHRHTLETAIEKETSGDYRNALLAFCTPRPVYVARRIHDAVYGAGTNDSLLVRMFAMNDRVLLQQAAAIYERTYGKSMSHAVNDDTSGDYKKLLQRLLRPC